MNTLAHDIRYGVRVLRKSPGFTLIALLALALGIGANTALFSLVYGVLLRPLPYAEGNRLVALHQSAPKLGIDDTSFSVKEIEDYRSQSHTVQHLEEYHSMNFILLGREPDRVRTGVVSAGFFGLLGVKPLLGRDFVAADENKGAPPVLVLSYNYWQQHEGGDPKIVGTKYKMNDRVHTVIGVLPPIPQFPNADDVYMPTSACPFRSSDSHLLNRDMRMMDLFGRLATGAKLQDAEAEMKTIAGRLQQTYPASYPSNSGFTADVESVHHELTARARPMLLVLIATAGLILLISCANVANLSLARMMRREHEVAIRTAMGASRAQLVRQMLTESTLLAIAGGALGLVLAWAGMDLLVAFIAKLTTRAHEVSINLPVLLFTLAVSVITGLAFGAIPAFTVKRDLIPALKTSTGGSTPTIHGQGARSALIVAQVALSFVMLIAAGLMIRSFIRLQKVDAGYNSTNVLTMTLPWDWSKYADAEKLRLYEEAILQRVSTLPGVVTAGITSGVPLENSQPNQASLEIEGHPLPPGVIGPTPAFMLASVDAFQTLGIPLVTGRTFAPTDRPDSMQVAVISHSMAKHYWEGQDPVGRRISFDQGKHWITIVGVVGDVKQYGLDHPAADTIYRPISQSPGGRSLSVKTTAEPGAMARLVTKAIRELNPEQAIVNVKTLDEVRGESVATTRVTAALLGSFAVLALIIAATGLAGVISFLVNQRTREIGIRMALGAKTENVLGMVLRQGMTLAGAGLLLGVVGALMVTRVLQTYLFGVTRTDALTFASVAVVLGGAALLATYLPARRACEVDPVVALRCD